MAVKKSVKKAAGDMLKATRKVKDAKQSKAEASTMNTEQKKSYSGTPVKSLKERSGGQRARAVESASNRKKVGVAETVGKGPVSKGKVKFMAKMTSKKKIAKGKK